jgi:hypothetical protein
MRYFIFILNLQYQGFYIHRFQIRQLTFWREEVVFDFEVMALALSKQVLYLLSQPFCFSFVFQMGSPGSFACAASL